MGIGKEWVLFSLEQSSGFHGSKDRVSHQLLHRSDPRLQKKMELGQRLVEVGRSAYLLAQSGTSGLAGWRPKKLQEKEIQMTHGPMRQGTVTQSWGCAWSVKWLHKSCSRPRVPLVAP